MTRLFKQSLRKCLELLFKIIVKPLIDLVNISFKELLRRMGYIGANDEGEFHITKFFYLRPLISSHKTMTC